MIAGPVMSTASTGIGCLQKDGRLLRSFAGDSLWKLPQILRAPGTWNMEQEEAAYSRATIDIRCWFADYIGDDVLSEHQA